MPVVGLRQLSRETREVIEQLEKDGEPVVVTRHGKPVAALTPVSESDAASFALAVVPEFVASRQRAEEAIKAGEGLPARQVLAELEAEDDNVDEARTETALPSLVEWLAAVAEVGVPQQLGDAESIHTLNVDLIQTLLRESLTSIAERVRTVNENIAAEVGTDNMEESLQRYESELERVAAAQRMASRSSPASDVPVKVTG